MAHWCSYGYPEDDPKIWVTFGPQRGAPPSVAFLGAVREPDGHKAGAVEYYQEVAGRWVDERAAREELNQVAQVLIEQKRL